MTYEEQLENVQKAIEAIELGGQEYSLEVSVTGGNSSKRGMTRADLGRLYKREAFLRKMIDRQQGGGCYEVICD